MFEFKKLIFYDLSLLDIIGMLASLLYIIFAILLIIKTDTSNRTVQNMVMATSESNAIQKQVLRSLKGYGL